MTERGAPLSVVGFYRHPPLSPDATILNYLNNDKEGFVGLWRPVMPPPPRPRRHNT